MFLETRILGHLYYKEWPQLKTKFGIWHQMHEPSCALYKPWRFGPKNRCGLGHSLQVTQNTSFQKHKTPFLVFGNSYFPLVVFQNYRSSITNTSFSILVNEFLGRNSYRDQYKKQETRFFLICITYKSNCLRVSKT